MLGENGPRTECRIPAELHRHLYLFFLKKQKKNLKISQKLLVSQRSNIGVGAAVLVVWCQQRASGAAPCNSCTPHTHSHIVTVCTGSQLSLPLCSKHLFPPADLPPPQKKKNFTFWATVRCLHSLSEEQLQVPLVTLQFNGLCCIRRTTSGAFSDPVVQWPLLYQNNNFRCL